MNKMLIVSQLMFIIPVYFQVTKNASTGKAGAYLVPAVIGNTVGGLLTGAWIKRCERHPIVTTLSHLWQDWSL